LALDNKAPKKWQPPPAVGKYNVSSRHPEYQILVKKYKDELATRKKIMLQNEMYFQRKALTQRCVTLYSHKPYDIDELKSIAEKILKGHEGTAKELIAQVEAEIKRLTQREEEIRRIEKGDAPAKGNK